MKATSKILLTLLLFLTSGLNTLHANELQPVIIGFDGEYGLKNSTSAQAIELGLRVAIEEVNAAGGVLGGRPLELQIKDNRSVPSRGVANIKQFAAVTDLVAVVGGRFSPVQLQQVDLVHELKLPLLNVWGAANGITDHGHEPSFTFRLSLKDDWAVPTMLKQIKKQGKQRIGVLLPNSGWGRSNRNSLSQTLPLFPEQQVVDTVWYNFGERTMLPKYQQLLAKGVDIILFVGNDNEGSRLMRELGEKPDVPRVPIVSHWGVTGGQMVEASGTALQEMDFSVVQTFSFFNASAKPLARFMQGAERIAGIHNIEQLSSPVGSAHAYDMLHILAKAVDRAGSTDRIAIRKALESGIHHKGLVRDYAPAFTPDNHNALSPQQTFMARFRKDGVIVPLQ